MTPFAGRSGITATPKIQTGTVTLGAGSSPRSATVTFPEPFAAPPVMPAPNSSNSFASASVASVTATGFTVFVRRFDDTALSSSVDVSWIAVGV